ncbi:MAG: metallopeptidase family protein [Gemmatimonadales bacterium]|nr:metallopeptidase family protein [Gemmatimonadales bacterium]
MRLADFETMVRRLSSEVPSDFFEGIAEVVVSPRAVPDPEREEVFTLGECISLPVELGSGVEGLQSRIVLYYGSFAALAGLQSEFDWRLEAWETLTHELRHHLEWRARAPDLEEFDWAVEHNFARHDQESFDPTFFLSGEQQDGNYWVEDDVFIDQVVGSIPPEVTFVWQGRSYRVAPPENAELPCFLTVDGVANPPPGDLVVVLRRKPGVRDLFGRPDVFQAIVQATRPPGIFPAMTGTDPAKEPQK